jgi:hypothetical protein
MVDEHSDYIVTRAGKGGNCREDGEWRVAWRRGQNYHLRLLLLPARSAKERRYCEV